MGASSGLATEPVSPPALPTPPLVECRHVASAGRAATAAEHVSLACWLLVAITSALGLAAVEWDTYRELAQLSILRVGLLDRLIVFWLIVAKTLWVLSPVVAAVYVIGRVRPGRLAWIVWMAAATLVCAWLVIDLRAQRIQGNHLSMYLGYLANPNTWQWGGGVTGLVGPIFNVVAATAAGLAAAAYVVRRAARSPGRAAAAAMPLAWVVASVGVLAAERFVSSPLAFEQLHAALPLDPFGFDGLSRGAGALNAFRVDLNGRLNGELAAACRAASHPAPIDEAAVLPPGTDRHVVVLVLESFRHTALSAELMPNLAAASAQGRTFQQHYSGSNSSQFGLFALLYGRSALGYHATLDAGLPPQACATFRRAGYETTYASCAAVAWDRMEEFVDQRAFDNLWIDATEDWVAGDRRALAHVAQRLATAERPQFVVAFLMSTHHPYRYPVEFAQDGPVIAPEDVAAADASKQRQIMNRYRNAARFMDHELGRFLAAIDRERTLVVVTGDHGEALFDDGSATHASRLSDIQTRVPLLILGAGQGTTTAPTTHADVLPTVLHAVAGRRVDVAHLQGRDLLEEPPRERVLLCSRMYSNPWQVVLIHGQRRLNLSLVVDAGRFRVQGFVDDRGNPTPHALPQPGDAERWFTALREEISLLAR